MLFTKIISCLVLLLVAAASPIRSRVVRSAVEISHLNTTGVNSTLPAVLSAAAASPSVVPAAVSVAPSAVPPADLLDVLNRIAANGAREGMSMVLESYNASRWCAVQQSSWCPQTINSTANTIAADAVNALDFDADRCDNSCILEAMCTVTGNSTAMGLRSADYLLTRFNMTGSRQSHDNVRNAYSVLSSDDCVVVDRQALDQAVANVQVTETQVADTQVIATQVADTQVIETSGVPSSATVSSDVLSVSSDPSAIAAVAGEDVLSVSSETDVHQQEHADGADIDSVGDHPEQHHDDDDDHHLGAILGSTMGAGAVMGIGSAAAHHIASGPGPSLLSRLFGVFSGGVRQFMPHAIHAADLIKNSLTRGSTSTLEGIVLSDSSGSVSSGVLSPLPPAPPVPPQVPVQGKFPPWDATPPLDLIPEDVEPPYVKPPHYTLPGSSPPVELPYAGTSPDLVPPPAPGAPLPPLPPQPADPYDAIAQHQSHVLETIPEDFALDFTHPSDASSEASTEYDDYNSDASGNGADSPPREPLRPLRHSETLDNLRPLQNSDSLDSLRPLRGSEGSVEDFQLGDLQYPPSYSPWANPPLDKPPNAWNYPDTPPPAHPGPQHRPMRPSDYDEGSDTLYGATEASGSFPAEPDSSEDLFRGSSDSDPIYEPSQPSIPINPPLEPLAGNGQLVESPPSSPSEPGSDAQSQSSLDESGSEAPDSPDPEPEPEPEPEPPVEEPTSEAPPSPGPVDSPLEPPSPPSPVAPPEPHLFEGPPKYSVFENKYAKETLLSITSEAEKVEIYSKAGASFSNNKQLPYKLLDADYRPVKTVWRDPSTLTQLPGTVEEVDGRFLQRLPQFDGVAEMPDWAAAQSTPAPVPTLPEGVTYDEAYPEAYDSATSDLTDSASFDPLDDSSDYEPVADPAHDNQIDALDAEFADYQHDEEIYKHENENNACWPVNPYTDCSAHSDEPRYDTIQRPPTLGQVAGAVLPAALPLGGAAAAGRIAEVAELGAASRVFSKFGRYGRPPGGIEHDPEIFTGEYLPAVRHHGGGH